MRCMLFSVLALCVLCLVPAANAAIETVDFESDALGNKLNGFVSNSSPLVSFTDSVGAGLAVGNYSESNFSNALAVFTDFDDSELIMNFSVSANSLSLDFGNDDPGFSNPGDLAVLTIFQGLTQVGQTSVVMNRDDMMNQTISIAGIVFDRATFKYTVDPTQGLIEVIDNVTFNTVPEPASVAVWSLLGLIGIAVGWNRKRKVA